jgi:DNA anti-recombination protein RmuC
MKQSRYLIYLTLALFLGTSLIGCKPKIDTMAHSEKMFIRMADKTAGKLDLSGDQKAKLDQLKMDIHKNFQEGGNEKREALMKIKEEAMKENPDIGKMTSSFQKMIQDEAQRINKGFDLMLKFQSNLNETQKKKLARMISERVKKWD